MRELAADARAGGRRVYFVGSGGSWASMYSGKYLCDRLTGAVSDVLPSYELIWRAPARLDPEALVVLAVLLGRTEDTLEALRFARERGARTVALVRDADSPIGGEARRRVRLRLARAVLPAAAGGDACSRPSGAGWTATPRPRELLDAVPSAARPDGRRLPLATRAAAASWPSGSPTPTCSTASAPGRCTASPTSSG